MGDVLPEEMQAMAGPLLGMMRSMGGAMFGTQIGQALGVLAGEVVGSTDIGLPLGPAGKAALLPGNIATFGEGLGVPQEEVRLYLALREAAHQRLFAHVPWLRSHLFGAVEGYARGIKVDTTKLEDVVGQIDPQHPEELQDALQQGMFQPEDTPEQKAALARLETALALVEGWVDAVVHAAAKPHLPSADALRETLRRRRATRRPRRADVRHADRSPAASAAAAGRLAAVGVADGRARPGGPRRPVGAPGHAADGGRPGRPGRLRAPRAAGLLRAGQDARRGRERRPEAGKPGRRRAREDGGRPRTADDARRRRQGRRRDK